MADALFAFERARPHRWAQCLASLLGFAPLLCAASVASAAIYYVDRSAPNCSDSGVGDVANPYCTIGAAVTKRGRPGVTIEVSSGLYREKVTVPASGLAEAPLVIEAIATNGPVVIDGTDDFA